MTLLLDLPTVDLTGTLILVSKIVFFYFCLLCEPALHLAASQTNPDVGFQSGYSWKHQLMLLLHYNSFILFFLLFYYTHTQAIYLVSFHYRAGIIYHILHPPCFNTFINTKTMTCDNPLWLTPVAFSNVLSPLSSLPLTQIYFILFSFHYGAGHS